MDAAYKTIVLTALVGLTPGAFAETSVGRAVDERVETLTRALSLSPLQQENVRRVLEEEIPRQQAARTDTDHRALREDLRQRVRALLNEAQQVIFDQMRDGVPSPL